MKKLLNRLLALALAGALCASPALAVDISQSQWSETDASNNSTSPNGFPEGMAPSGVNDSARAVMGALKRFWKRANGVVTSAGTSTVYTLTYDVAPAALVDGEAYAFEVDEANTGAVTLNINSLGAKSVKKQSSSGYVDLASGDWFATQRVIVQYDSATDTFRQITNIASVGSVTSVATAGLASGGPITTTGTVTVSINSQTAETAPATGDEIAIYDQSAGAHRKMALSDLWKVVGGLTSDNAPDAANDSVPFYDASAGTTDRVAIQSLSATALLQCQTASASSQIDFALDGFPGFRSFDFVLDYIKPTTDAVDLWMRVSTDGGTTFDAGVSDYDWIGHIQFAGGIVSDNDTADSEIHLNLSDTLGNGAAEHFSTTVRLYNATGTGQRPSFSWEYVSNTSFPRIGAGQAVGTRLTNQDTTDVRFLVSSGTIASGTICLYGIR